MTPPWPSACCSRRAELRQYRLRLRARLLVGTPAESLAQACVRGDALARQAVCGSQPGPCSLCSTRSRTRRKPALPARSGPPVGAPRADRERDHLRQESCARPTWWTAGRWECWSFSMDVARVLRSRPGARRFGWAFSFLVLFERGSAPAQAEVGFCVDAVVHGPRPSDAELSRIGSEWWSSTTATCGRSTCTPRRGCGAGRARQAGRDRSLVVGRPARADVDKASQGQ